MSFRRPMLRHLPLSGAAAAAWLSASAFGQAIWDGGNNATGANWGSSSSWVSTTPTNYGDVVFNDTAVKASATTQAVSLGGNRYVDDLTITGDVAYTFNNSSNSRLYLDSNDGSNATITVNASATGSANHTINSKVKANDNVTITQNATGRDLTFNSTFDANGYDVTFAGSGSTVFTQNFSNASDLTKTGSGTLEFNGTVATVSTLTLSGGTLLLDTGGHITGTTILVTGNTILDFGNSGSNYLDFSNLIISAGVTLTITNWTAGLDYFAVANNPGNTTTNRIVFADYGTYGKWTDDCYIGYVEPGTTPIPEPSTYGAIAMTLLGGLYVWRRRVPTAKAAAA